MPETKTEIVEHFEASDEPTPQKIGETVSIVEVSDEELVIETVEKETAEANDNALLAYQNYDSLTLAQKDKILKGLLGDFISRHRENYT